MSTLNTAYVMENPREAKRLAEKVNPVEWVARYVSAVGKDCRRVLDVGCGPAVIAAEVARQLDHSEVIGIDLSDARLVEARKQLNGRPNLSMQKGSATSLPFADESFDLVYSRFLLEYLPDRQEAVAEMARVCRPGGRVLLQDLDGQLVWHYPIEQNLQDGIERVLAAMSRGGFDPYVGRKLFALARGAGLSQLTVAAEPYHLYAGRIDDENFRLWELKLDIALPAMAMALGDENKAHDLKAQFLDHLRRDDTLTYSVVFTVTGTKEPGSAGRRLPAS